MTDNKPQSISIHQLIVVRAAEVLGGNAALASRLQVPPQTLDGWISGVLAIPTPHFLSAVDIVLNDPSEERRRATRALLGRHDKE
jgi:hypothetical protein